ncbi:MAG: hypothetical protein ACKO4A_14645 [Gammaproteobacteria bacterium]
MKIPLMTVRQVWQAWGAVASVLALPILVFGGSGVPGPNLRSEAELASGVPVLPAVGVLLEDREELAGSAMWGAAPSAGAAAAAGTTPQETGPAWTLAGVFMKDERREVVLRFAGDAEPPKLLQEGETLPDGSRVARIERDRIELRGTDEGTSWWVHVNRGAEAVSRTN